ncbi:SDR family NAD(P)-dependent oxidoreductase [Niveispirillum sp. SYP-B3756]|uniref:SDR family NAD(P)-dependent oxidoreductase n=1 Tax=Niveispirillum sp. SYP-B3756 TaxID=2662178 RepID=UPI0012914F92|nr:SDR family NAD(P)-dependent oxidoreductase [Niveispirillum sp. SYP-B3756]MQP66431.1 SDR family NAD(P)-dependent oxidoreductase [Niveispirillum sp. SYP-B3756]
MNMTSNRNDLDGAIAIIGMGLRVPGADTAEGFWRNLSKDVCSITRFTPDQLRAAGVPVADYTRPDYVPVGGILPDVDRFDASFFGFTAREAECLAPQNRLLFECCWEALENAGYDPKGTPGRTGLFFGQSLNSYWQNNVEPNLTALDVGLDFFANPDFLSTGIAYKLDLRGPALTVQSFCSTSLLAVHLARQSLLEGECDMALAGGASVRIPQAQGYIHMPDSLYSPDGVVRAFDAGANGTLFSNGVGTVLLKRLEDALEDGDRIVAVIRGSAANNDGGRKAGYNAPSVDGQARVVAQALRDASVAADSIGYVECHGTGTLLGDPVEVAALTKAHRVFTDRQGYCAIGSVKPNIGHADRASGVVSLIKAALCLRHRTLPGLLNYRSPNPRLDLDGSPFYINTQAQPWEAADGPRRAGVTSLGYGGTNVHLVLEEAPPQPMPKGATAPQAIILSARSPAALDAASRRLADHLEANPGLPLDAIAHTLQAGRHGFNHRRAVVGASIAEIIGKLRRAEGGRDVTVRNPPVQLVLTTGIPPDQAAALIRALIAWGITPASLTGPGADRVALALEPATFPVRPADAPVDAGHVRLDIGTGSPAQLLADLWLAGVIPDWRAVWEGTPPARLGLPTYPFERERYWLNGRQEQAGETGETSPSPALAPDEEGRPVFQVPSWRRLPPLTGSAGPARCRIVVLDGAALGDGVADALEALGDTIIRIAPGATTTNPAERRYTVDATRADHLDALLNRLKIWGPTDLVLCTPAPVAGSAEAALAAFSDLHRWIRAVDAVWPGKPWGLTIVAPGLFQVTGTDMTVPALAVLPALAAVAAQEYPHLSCRVIDAGSTAAALAAEIRQGGGDGTSVALRGPHRWAATQEGVEITEEGPSALAHRLRPGGTYLITGGLGGIGYTLASHLASTLGARLALVSRAVPAAGDTDAKARRLAALTAQGGQVLALAADTGDAAQMAGAVAVARARFGRIDGVIHAAGLPGATTLDRLTMDEARAVIAPKVAGAAALIDLLRDDPPDFLVFCSSLAAVRPTVGQGHYAAANAVLDALAQTPDAPMPILSVNWNSWRTVGMAQDIWNRQATLTPLDHPRFRERVHMPDGEVRFHARLDGRTDWLLADHRVAGRPTMPGTGILDLILQAHVLHQGGAFQPVEIRDLVFQRLLATDTAVELRIGFVPLADGLAVRVESVAPDAEPVLHAHATLRPLADTAETVAVTPGTQAHPLPGRAPDGPDLGDRWNCLTRLTSGNGRSVADLSLHVAFQADLAATVLHPALVDIALSIHHYLRGSGGLALPVGYRRLRVHAPLGADLVSIVEEAPRQTDTCMEWTVALADRTGRVRVAVEGFALVASDHIQPPPPPRAQADGLHGNPFEADSITPAEGIAIFRALPLGLTSQLMVSRGRPTPVRKAATTEPTFAQPVATQPRDEAAVRAALATLWQRILGGGVPSADAHFFELGGNSLGATRVLSHIREVYGVTLGIKDFFADPTLTALARRVVAGAAQADIPAAPDDDRDEGVL